MGKGLKISEISFVDRKFFEEVLCEKLEEMGFERKDSLKSGDFEFGMVKDDLEIVFDCSAGINSIYICLPVDEGVGENGIYKRGRPGGRSVLVAPQNFMPSPNKEFLSMYVDFAWDMIQDVIERGEAILYFRKDHIYPDYVKKKNRVSSPETYASEDKIALIKAGVLGSLLGLVLDKDTASDLLNLLSTVGVDSPDAIKNILMFFADSQDIQRIASGAFLAVFTTGWILAFRDGIKKSISKKNNKKKDLS